MIENDKVKGNGFHRPKGEEFAFLPLVIKDRDMAKRIIGNFLDKDKYEALWMQGKYSTSDPEVAKDGEESRGILFVTSNRLLFWAETDRKPYKGLFYKDISNWKSSRHSLSNRAVTLLTGGTSVSFIANKEVVNAAERSLNAEINLRKKN
jgi:hypothetical protein